jgi:hypothetical protein
MDKPVRVKFFKTFVEIRIRVLLPHGDDWHSLIWFKMGKDGSFYFGPSYRPTTESSWERKVRPGTSYGFSKVDFVEITDPALIKHSRTSMHASGAINLAGERFFRDPLLSTPEQEHLCSILFERPKLILKSAQGIIKLLTGASSTPWITRDRLLVNSTWLLRAKSDMCWPIKLRTR